MGFDLHGSDHVGDALGDFISDAVEAGLWRLFWPAGNSKGCQKRTFWPSTMAK